MSKIIVEREYIKPDIKKFTEEQLKYFDYERIDETLTRFIFPTCTKKEDGDIMEDKYYKFISSFLKQQYKLPVKFLDPDIDSCSYICQKSIIVGNTKKIADASITIEPLNQNVFMQISYTPINQAFELGTVISLRETIPYTNEDGSTPSRRVLTSASLMCQPLQGKTFTHEGKTYDIKYNGLCNRCIPYSSIDIGSEIIGKFIIKTSELRQSMTLYNFRRPEDNILEIITPDYLNVSISYVLDLTEENLKKSGADKETLDIMEAVKSAIN